MPTGNPWVVRVAVLLCAVFASGVCAAEKYELGPDSQPQDGVPHGKLEQHRWTSSKIFPGTERDYWVYVPAQYDGSQPACVTVFQDGEGYAKPDGQIRATNVLDNLIHKKEIPLMIGVFINPGNVPPATPGKAARNNRSFEYDSMSDAYARFLLEEILPEVGKTYKLKDDATSRAICGASSGGICALNVAWERPEAFSRVISFVGSFTDIRGGNDFPNLVRKTESKAIRIYLQDGANDLDNFAGAWLVANQDLDRALSFAGYEHQLVVGEEGHNHKHGAAVLPEAMRYVWNDYPKLPAKGTFPVGVKDNRTVINVIDPNEPWQLVGEGYKFTEGPAADASGRVYFTDVPDSKIYRIGDDGKPAVFASDTKGANGTMFGPDGRLYAAAGKSKSIVAYNTADAKFETIAEDVDGNDLVVAHDGGIYVTEPSRHQLTYINPKREKSVVDKGLNFPNGIILSPDQGELIVADMRTRNLFAFHIKPDGSLTDKSPLFILNVPGTAAESGADGLTVDTEGRIYAATSAGLQVLGPSGVVIGILEKPQHAWLANACFGGKDFDTLYVTCADKVYKRKSKAKGVLSFQPPVTPAAKPK